MLLLDRLLVCTKATPMCLNQEEGEAARRMDSQSCYRPISDPNAFRKAVAISAAVAERGQPVNGL